jgi:hypothetical protein
LLLEMAACPARRWDQRSHAMGCEGPPVERGHGGEPRKERERGGLALRGQTTCVRRLPGRAARPTVDLCSVATTGWGVAVGPGERRL